MTNKYFAAIVDNIITADYKGSKEIDNLDLRLNNILESLLPRDKYLDIEPMINDLVQLNFELGVKEGIHVGISLVSK